jgi:hypothetical protein
MKKESIDIVIKRVVDVVQMYLGKMPPDEFEERLYAQLELEIRIMEKQIRCKFTEEESHLILAKILNNLNSIISNNKMSYVETVEVVEMPIPEEVMEALEKIIPILEKEKDKQLKKRSVLH